MDASQEAAKSFVGADINPELPFRLRARYDLTLLKYEPRAVEVLQIDRFEVRDQSLRPAIAQLYP
jgi:hypothetical protein